MNASIFQKINELALESFWLDMLGIFLAKYLAYILAICLLLFLVRNFKKYWSIVSLALASGVLARGITELIRFLWERPRPFVENHVNLLINHVNGSAFPSAHTSFFFAISTVLYFYNKKIGIFFLVASFLVAGSRVYCGVHWPYDILGGIIVGVFSGLIAIKASRAFKFKR